MYIYKPCFVYHISWIITNDQSQGSLEKDVCVYVDEIDI